jgi:hypothetical protein
MTVRTLSLLAGFAVTAPAAAATWTAVLAPAGGSKVDGSAVAESVAPDSTRTTIRIAGGPAGTEMPWHIHRGACGTGGPVLGAAPGYPTLKVGKDGTAGGTVTLPVAIPASGEHSVTVHQSSRT